MQHTTGSFTGVNDVTIFTQSWLPDDAPRAVVLLAHGIGEHSGRYAHVAATLTAHGYALYALDHRGHGRSGGDRVAVRSFDDFVADLRTCYEQARAAHPELPIFLYGHSMGSLIALLFAFHYQDDLAGLITTGTALKPFGLSTALIPLIKGATALTPNVRLIPLDPSGVSRDPAVVQAYRDDPLVFHGRIPCVTLGAFARAVQTCLASLPDLRLPYLVLHGGVDPMTHVSATGMIRRSCGAPDTTITVYDGLRHEIHNEPEQAQVLADVVAWLDAHLPGAD
jgi:alpha-beta hydrolase superfamily lysophospholipase